MSKEKIIGEKINNKNEEIRIIVESFYNSEGSGLEETFCKVIYDELKQKIA